MPSPQRSALQLPWLSQVQPGSTRQVCEQPSPLTLFPSSHCSSPATIPSPQCSAKHCAALQSQPSSSLQLLEHPSPLPLLPSSISSLPALMYSPRCAATHGV